MPTKRRHLQLRRKTRTIYARMRAPRSARVLRRIRGGQNTADSVVAVFFDILNTVKLYHWNTRSFAQHKATDELYAKLNENTDKFVEILVGKDERHISVANNRAKMIDVRNADELKDKIHEFRAFLIAMSSHFDAKEDSDLLSVRDDILGDLNQFLYLLLLDAPTLNNTHR